MIRQSRLVSRGIVLFLCMMCLTSLASCILCGNARATVPQVGDLSPLFNAADVHGKMHSLDQALKNGQTTIVFFWALRCASCLREMAYLDEIYKRYKDKGVEILGVEANRNTNAQIAEIMEKIKNIQLTPGYPIMADIDGKLSESFGVKEVPQTFLISKSGIITFYLNDFIGENKIELEDKLDEAVSPKPKAKLVDTLPPAGSAAVPSSEPPPGEAPTITRAESEKIKVINTFQDDFEKYRYFGDFYYNRQELDRAMSAYLNCLEIDPKNVYVRIKIGEIYALKKDFPKAREFWEGVLRMDPGNREADANIRKLIRGDF